MRDRTWQEELRYLFADAFGLPEGSPLPGAFYTALTDAIGRASKVDLAHAVEIEDETRFLFVYGDSAYLVRFEEPRTTELTAFADLSGGRYTERIQVEEKALEIKMQYEHRRLGRGETLRARFAKPIVENRAYMSDQTERELDRGQKLRETFQRWSKLRG